MNIRDDTRATRETSFGWMISRISGDLNRRMNERLAGLGLTLASFGVMMCILESGPMTQTEIGRQFRMPPYAISRAIDALEEMGLVQRRAHETSRRAHSIHATDKGEALGPALHRIVRETNAELTEGLSDAEAAQLGTILRKLLPAAG